MVDLKAVPLVDLMVASMDWMWAALWGSRLVVSLVVMLVALRGLL